MAGLSEASGARSAAVRTRRWAACLGLVLGGLVPSAAAQSPDRVYDIRIEYAAPCAGSATGEIRVLGPTMQVFVGDGTNVSPLGSAPINPDGTFNFVLGEPATTGRYQANGSILDVSTTATGTVRAVFLGQTFGEIGECNFTLTGTLRPGSLAPTSTTAGGATAGDREPLPEEEVFDPTSTAPLSDGEVVWLLRQQGVGDGEIGTALARADLAASADPNPFSSPPAEERYFSLISTLIRARTPDGDRAFPHVEALAQENGPLAALGESDVTSNDTARARAFHRLLRICITEGL